MFLFFSGFLGYLLCSTTFYLRSMPCLILYTLGHFPLTSIVTSWPLIDLCTWYHIHYFLFFDQTLLTSIFSLLSGSSKHSIWDWFLDFFEISLLIFFCYYFVLISQTHSQHRAWVKTTPGTWVHSKVKHDVLRKLICGISKGFDLSTDMPLLFVWPQWNMQQLCNLLPQPVSK